MGSLGLGDPLPVGWFRKKVGCQELGKFKVQRAVFFSFWSFLSKELIIIQGGLFPLPNNFHKVPCSGCWLSQQLDKDINGDETAAVRNRGKENGYCAQSSLP